MRVALNSVRSSWSGMTMAGQRGSTLEMNIAERRRRSSLRSVPGGILTISAFNQSSESVRSCLHPISDDSRFPRTSTMDGLPQKTSSTSTRASIGSPPMDSTTILWTAGFDEADNSHCNASTDNRSDAFSTASSSSCFKEFGLCCDEIH